VWNFQGLVVAQKQCESRKKTFFSCQGFWNKCDKTQVFLNKKGETFVLLLMLQSGGKHKQSRVSVNLSAQHSVEKCPTPTTQQPLVGQGVLTIEIFTLTLRRATLGRTPLDEWSARRRDLYLTTHNSHNTLTSIPPAGFEPAIPTSERLHSNALARAATGTGRRQMVSRKPINSEQ
jgi:hypothetical protein